MKNQQIKNFKLNKIGRDLIIAEFPWLLSDWNNLKDNVDSFENILLWSRKRIKKPAEEIKDISLVVSGHTVVDNVARICNHLWIDRGGVFYDKFTVLQVQPTIEIFEFDL